MKSAEDWGDAEVGLSTSFRHWINLPLAKANLRLETLTGAKFEKERVRKLVDRGYFQEPAFPLLDSFASFEATPMVDAYASFGDDCRRLLAPDANANRYDPANEYFTPADACPTYLIARAFKPRLWLEVGSGNSTKVARQAIDDGKLGAKLNGLPSRPPRRARRATLAISSPNEPHPHA